VSSEGISETLIGETFYDLQSNNAMANRIMLRSSADESPTWTTGVLLPWLDSANYKFIVSDSYAIETQGDIAVIAVFSQWYDITLI
jgi:hypothetical protein